MPLNHAKILTVKASGDLSTPMLMTGKAGEYDIIMDQPDSWGGTSKGSSPMELVVAALVGCAGITFARVARKLDFKYFGGSFEASGDIDPRGYMGEPGVCKHFCNFGGTFVIDTDEPEERLREVVDIVEDRCPVYNLLHDAGVNTQIEWKKK